MKVNRVSYVPYIQRVGRYHFQMVQAKLNTPVEPISTYNLQPYYTRQQQWMTELSDSLSRLYRYSADLDEAAKAFDSTRPNTETDRLLRQTRLLVDRFNRLHHFLQENEHTLATQKLVTFERVAKTADTGLQPFGISLLATGELELDEQIWLKAVEARSTDFADAMQGLSLQFREEVLQLQNKPLSTFSRYYDEVAGLHPYSFTSISSLQYQHITKTGLFLNVLW
ncbi:hypothetical protein [Brevibacillus sp. NRS-1366]|uniref:hypothetical protein n=1 Tax=Brevibacillus sp. NRS-1366 TaxID=3233899 RepID=UPI003D1AF09F